jgi:hypothetical protein
MSEKRDREIGHFKGFLELEPEFCGEPLAKWDTPDDEKDFPDVKGLSASGKKIGVEIGEWLNEDEMAASKSKEKREAAYLDAIGDQGKRFTKNIEYIWLYARRGRIEDKDSAAFREQLFRYVVECDERWPRERYWAGGPILKKADFAPYPMLVKYLEAIKLHPWKDSDTFKYRWVWFTANVGVFDQDTMLIPLRDLMIEKIEHYGARTGFDQLSLLLVYHQAALYNSPADTPLHSYEDAVKRVRTVIGEDLGAFDSVFLYIAVNPGRRVMRIC